MPTNKKETTAVNNVPKQQAIVSDATPAPVKSRRKVSFKEFILGKNLKREVVAGFKMYVDGVEFMTEKEWNATYNNYINRK
jgi:hypothetical protein